MPAGRSLIGGTVGDAGQDDTLALLTEAVSAYLREIEGYRDVCQRSATRAAVLERSAGLEVTRSYAQSDEVLSQVQSALSQLPVWASSKGRRGGSRRGDAVGSRAPALALPLATQRI